MKGVQSSHLAWHTPNSQRLNLSIVLESVLCAGTLTKTSCCLSNYGHPQVLEVCARKLGPHCVRESRDLERTWAVGVRAFRRKVMNVHPKSFFSFKFLWSIVALQRC